MTEEKIYWSPFEYQSTKLFVAASDKGLCYVALPNESFETMEQWIFRHFSSPVLVRSDQGLQFYTNQLHQYFQKQLTVFSMPLDLRGTPFQVSVWNELRQIPYGETRSYFDIAIALDNPKATRAVGTANGKNPIPIIIPCHRVIGKNGTLTGFRGGLRFKETLLQLEGMEQYDASGHVRFNF
ncbi:methylated-DNA--[protein]-cysteine S-methyltransferase [Lederbergia sp. NSJ-179]|uniref:methylated-DNA--[protein]-cysteine S-methyltransferase n=1 Tax=Lederbergia sp. NSJ-179 TaxID=2931402 RepID=UPI001FD5514C|nr:methylated-DNA--[protein]-cysteine S-methyltransferase [Lederbergia sp. NSJ-179]MCJ7841463.1 methylated-DNA--[protein]-cysteine S-methyltransferase [Lederbergia sp. NSJ-179]